MKYAFIANQEKRASQLISQGVSGLSKSALNALFKQGEVRVNGIKQKTDCDLATGDRVSVFVPAKYLSDVKIEIAYADKNIVIVNKPAGLDVEHNLLHEVHKSFLNALPVHRLDRATSGLVVFALNVAAQKELLSAFKRRSIDKFYYALVCGHFDKAGEHVAYLKKDCAKSQVKIFNTPVEGAKKIVTQFLPLSYKNKKTLLQVKLITGRTHQIRAHLSHIGFAVAGDNKYNYEDKSSKQPLRLCAYKIVFNGLNAPLDYLNGKEYKINTPANFID